MLSKNHEDGCLCDRCGDVAVHFHEDYGNMCRSCEVRIDQQNRRLEQESLSHRDWESYVAHAESEGWQDGRSER